MRGITLLAVAACLSTVLARGQADDTTELRGPLRWVVLSDAKNAQIGNEFAALRLRGDDLVIDTRASRPAESQSNGRAVALVFPIEEGGALAALVGHGQSRMRRERGGPVVRQALLVSNSARLFAPTTSAILVACTKSAVTVHGSRSGSVGGVIAIRASEPLILDVAVDGRNVLVLLRDGAGLFVLTIHADGDVDGLAPPFQTSFQRAALVGDDKPRVVAGVWTDPEMRRALALVHDSSNSSTVGLCNVDFEAETATVKETQRLPIALSGVRAYLSVDFLQCSDNDRQYLAVGHPSDDHGSGVLRIFGRDGDSEVWTSRTSFYPQRDKRFDGIPLASGGGEAVVLHELGTEARVVAFVSAPLGGVFSALHCLDVENGVLLWTLPETEFLTAGGVVGRALEVVELPSGWTLLKATRTRAMPGGGSPSGYDHGGVPVLLLDALSGEIVSVN